MRRRRGGLAAFFQGVDGALKIGDALAAEHQEKFFLPGSLIEAEGAFAVRDLVDIAGLEAVGRFRIVDGVFAGINRVPGAARALFDHIEIAGLVGHHAQAKMVAVMKGGSWRHLVVVAIAVAKEQRIANADLLIGNTDELGLLSVAVLGDEFRLDMRARVGGCCRGLFRRGGQGAIRGRFRARILRNLHKVAGRPEDVARRRLLRVNTGRAGDCKRGDAEQNETALRKKRDRHLILPEHIDYCERALFTQRNPTSLDA